jgi:protein-disulfide isomerase
MALLRIPVTSRDHVIGDDDAPVTVVEYGDYECPFCAAAHPVVKQILARHGKNLRFLFRHFPLVEVHPHAEPAAETAEFAASQGLFWPMHDAIFANQHRLSIPLLIALAASLKLSPIALRDALADGRFAEKVQADFAGGVRSGVNGTPTFFINGVRFDSPLGVAALPAAIDATMRVGGSGYATATNANSPRRVTVLVHDGSPPDHRFGRAMSALRRG